ncbi:hypothetical protein SS50377_21689 [Spironucleus salmonicida]|uniref:Uncharacterized protein n=1 Tax=Spironucleus salmonicida TaxID=348837 RepID=A0A9P8S0Q6_9EUKA|nr:hypothetical protein SS50377_21689 [Spironucleus salmonicida]
MLRTQFQQKQPIYENIPMQILIIERVKLYAKIERTVKIHIAMTILLAEYHHIEQFFKEGHNNNRQSVQHNHGITLRFFIFSKRMFYHSISKVAVSLSHTRVSF